MSSYTCLGDANVKFMQAWNTGLEKTEDLTDQRGALGRFLEEPDRLLMHGGDVVSKRYG